jgi:hypothetical protein
MAESTKRAFAPVTKSPTEEFRAGAFASLSALRTIDRIVDHYRNGAVDSKNYFHDRELIRAAMVSQAGPAAPFIQGFISALAEYIDTFMQDSDGPMLELWKPESAMTESEIKAERALIFEGEEAVNRISSLEEVQHG